MPQAMPFPSVEGASAGGAASHDPQLMPLMIMLLPAPFGYFSRPISL
jgi:hypothetical protein